MHDTYFSLACESEGTDDPFPFAYIVVVVAGQFFQRKHKRAAKFALCALDDSECKERQIGCYVCMYVA